MRVLVITLLAENVLSVVVDAGIVGFDRRLVVVGSTASSRICAAVGRCVEAHHPRQAAWMSGLWPAWPGAAGRDYFPFYLRRLICSALPHTSASLEGDRNLLMFCTNVLLPDGGLLHHRCCGDDSLNRDVILER